MPYQYGVLTGADNSDLTLPVNSVGQQVVFDDLNQYLERVEADTQAAQAVFVEADTENYSESYALPGGSGRMQRRSKQSSVGVVKASGKVDVGYPLEDFADGLGWNDIDIAYMSLREFQRQVNNIEDRNRNTVRFEMLKALFTNTNRTFVDDQLKTPTVTVKPLANGDADKYPPVAGSDDPATEDHYLTTGYAVSAISNTNNPVATAVGELTQHFGDSGAGEDIFYFAGSDVSAKVQDLTSFYPVTQNNIVVGANTDVVTNVPTGLPGVVRGRMGAGAWLVEWLWMPAAYAITIHGGVARPLKRRVDPAFTGLPRGLNLVATDKQFPFTTSYWRNRYGYGVGNRLNGVVQYFAAPGSYVIPTAYQ